MVEDKLEPRVIVRKANVNDLSQLVDCAESAFEHEYKRFKGKTSRDYFADMIRSDFNGVYVAESDGRLLGFAVYIPVLLTGTCELLQIGIKKEAQGQGIGTKLLSESMKNYVEKLKEKGIDFYALYLTVSEDNLVGQNLYKKLGFEVTGRIRDTFIGSGNVEIVMSYILDRTKKYPKGELWTKEKGA